MGLALRKQQVVEVPFEIRLHAKQGIAFDTPATEVFYGGAAGGGKSHLMRMASIAWALAIPGLMIYVFRRTHVDLVKNHLEGPKGFRALLADWVNRGWCKIVDDSEIRFSNGSKIFLCHCKDAKDVYKYQGAEIHVLIIDELTHWQEDMYRFLRGRVRMVGLTLPAEYRGRFPRILCSGNPGNIGHLWVKQTFIDGVEPFEIVQQPESEGGLLRQYIPARVNDNRSLREDDPGYEARLGGLGSAALVKAMLEGDWSVVEGAFFDEWSSERHVIKPFVIPKDWTRFIAVDWGSSHPFSVGWYAVVQDDFVIPGTNYFMPRGSLLRYREWYGIAIDQVTKKPKANVGLKLTVKALAQGIKQRSIPDTSEGIKYAYVVMDPSMFAEDGGPSKAETFIKNGIRNVRKGDNKRTPKGGAEGGWDQVRARLRGDGWTEDGPGPEWVPALFFFSTCVHAIRTVPVLQHDKDKPEDLDTDGEDHAADEIRYACMSRPYAKRPVEVKPAVQELTYTAIQQPDGTVVVQSNIGMLQVIEERNKRAAKRRKK